MTNENEIWCYDEPHKSGGNCHVTMTKRQAVDFMLVCYPEAFSGWDEENIFDEWVVLNWAWKEEEMIGRREFGLGVFASLFQGQEQKESVIQWGQKSRKSYAFDPQPDITAYELAKVLLGWSSSLGGVEKLFENLPEVKRHFKEVE